jgi:hypothetical protein
VSRRRGAGLSKLNSMRAAFAETHGLVVRPARPGRHI